MANEVMTPQQQRLQFIELRAEGLSYEKITQELHISKGTCSSWEQELKDQIAVLKQEKLQELYDAYHMTKEARIKQLGDTLQQIDEAMDQVDFSEMPPDKLLEYKLKYTEALKDEYIGEAPALRYNKDSMNSSFILYALADLLNRIRTGQVNEKQAQKESTVLSNMLKAYDYVELEAKLENLERILANRR